MKKHPKRVYCSGICLVLRGFHRKRRGNFTNRIRAGREALEVGMTPDVILTEIESAQNALGELTGRTARSDMVSRIFERFCVGK